jgi:23S rRNA pseudouridine1911/1915/1917 synthase
MSTKALLTAVQTITLAHMKDFFLPRSFCLMATCDLVIAYKKAGQHTVPLVQGEGGSLLEEIGQAHEEILAPYGKKACEGLALHRLDSQTSGLVAFARTKEAYERMLGFQDSDRFIKRYLALTRPEDPQGPSWPFFDQDPKRITSAFRAFGPGRRLVRPTAQGRLYTTELDWLDDKACIATLAQGFRHQVRVHLAWSRHPIANDALYGSGQGTMGLCCIALEAPGIRIDLRELEDIYERP